MSVLIIHKLTDGLLALVYLGPCWMTVVRCRLLSGESEEVSFLNGSLT